MEDVPTGEKEEYNKFYRDGLLIGRWIRAEIEKEEMLAENIQIVEGLFRRQDLIDKLREAVDYDDLTGLLTRKAFETLVQERFIESQRPTDVGRIHSILFMDLDDFKTVNSTLGHPEGDAVIIHAAESIRKNLNRDQDFACRWGGEEFAAVLGDTIQDGALSVAKRIQSEINLLIPGEKAGESLGRQGISIGITGFPHGADYSATFKIAEEAMRAAKVSGKEKNQIVFAN